jgi:DNA polymerase-4/DNA polymerase V
MGAAQSRRAILHFDGDSFFASVEQAMNYRLRGKPVVTGAERGAATALSIEAKRLGLYRGMSMCEIRERCPDIIVVKSDYTAYSLYARRMYRIVRRYTDRVEEYSIDECFADITGLDRRWGMSYEMIGRTIQHELHEKLGVTFGVGLAPGKVLAKVGSKHRKPGGFTSLFAEDVESILNGMPVGAIWGLGSAMALRLQGLGIVTALQFARVDETWLREHRIAKPYREIWFELNGFYAKELVLDGGSAPGSILKTRTFAPATVDRAFVFAQLSRNLERACRQARIAGMRAGELGLMLKTQDFLYRNREVPLLIPTADPALMLRAAAPVFDRMFVPNVLYRATGVSLRRLVPEDAATIDFFGKTQAVNERDALLRVIDGLEKRYGAQTVVLASSLKAVTHKEADRQSRGKRTTFVHLPIEQKKKTIDLPFLGKAQ